MKIFSQSRSIALSLIDILSTFTISVFVNILMSLLLYGVGTDFSAGIMESLPTIIIFSFASYLGMSVFRTYSTIWRYATMRDLLRCTGGVFIGMVITAVAEMIFFPADNAYRIDIKSIYTLGISFLFTTLFLCLIRILYIIYSHTRSQAEIKNSGTEKKRTMIIGAGSACKVLLNEIDVSENSTVDPVCIIDDDPNKISRSFRGIKIYGPIILIPEICKKLRIDDIIFAIPSCSDERRREILNICASTGCAVRVLPKMQDIVLNSQILHQVTTIDMRELLNRGAIEIQDPAISNFISGKVCMVTGGGGSIGSELCRQIVAANPKQLIVVDIYENSAYELQQEILLNTDFKDLVVEIASVRDFSRMDYLIGKYRPNVIFHAAAHKHVPLMEVSPEEAVKNNVFGTFNVATLADFYQVDKMVLISTDKAVNPTNVMGATKRCCEMVMQYMAQQKTNTKFAVVRFGNVLGSNGSVIPLFRKQIEAGGPVTVTHPEIIRYFMTISEAVSLVLTSGAISDGGEIFVLDMGSPVKITTLAENLIRMYGYEPYTEMAIEFAGLRPGEKLYEELLMSEEGLKTTQNNKIFIGNQIHVDPDTFIPKLVQLKDIATNCRGDKDALLRCISDLVPTFNHAEN